MKIDSVKVYGFEPALHGMRNPMDSWEQADSSFYNRNLCSGKFDGAHGQFITADECPVIGPRDMELACKLITRGSEHRKFMRQIMVWMNITIPRYVWQELDTYKVATVRNSCSTMNKLGHRDLEQSDFQHPIPAAQLEDINELGRILRDSREEGKGIREARVQLKNDLCEGYLQKATFSLSYETVLSAILQREGHRLPEWRIKSEGSITQVFMSLPFMAQFYKAATWKRDQLRECAAELAKMALDVREGLALEADDIDNLRIKLKKAI